MLRLLFRYALLPLIALLLIGYAAIPLWVPSFAVMLLKPYEWQDVELTVGYPSHQSWLIKRLSWNQVSTAGTFSTSLKEMSLSYSWQSIKARQWPTFNIDNALSSIEVNPKGLPLISSITLIPSQWLSEWPEFNVNTFKLDLTIQGQPFGFSGQLKNQSTGLGILTKISTPTQQQLYLDATLSTDNKVEAKIFASQNSAPVAKVTSAINRQANTYVWQGQGAINLAYG